MDEDFGTPEAMAVLFDLAGEVNRTRSSAISGLLKVMGGCLGLLQGDPKTFLQWRQSVSAYAALVEAGDILTATATVGHTTESIDSMIAFRAQAKAAKNFNEADRIRKELLEAGIVLKDSPSGTTWEAQ